MSERGEIETAVEAGLGDDFVSFREQLKKGELSYCTRIALHHSGVAVIEDPFTLCTDCPLSHAYRDRGRMAIRLEHSGRVFGILTVSTSKESVLDMEERALLQELALDLGFAQYSMEDNRKRKQAEKHQKKLEAQLQQAHKMEAIGTLAGGIAHDFNNILAAIIGYTEIATMKLPKDNTVLPDLNEVLKAGKRAKDLVAQILAFSRQSRQERTPISIQPIVVETLQLLRASIPATVEIRKSIDARGLVMADATQIHQVMMNLCTNAHHAMEERGGTLEVDLSEVEIRPGDVDGNEQIQPGKYVRLMVGDTGKGMSLELQGKIFDPYFTTKEKGKGTGMGLSVVHGIVDEHGGRIDVRSVPEKGTKFTVYLPLIAGEAKTEEEEDKNEPIPTGTENILFVDDETPIVNLGKELLNRLGYGVTTETSGPAALELFRAQPEKFDLLCTDLNMPGMTGIDLAREVKRIRADAPVVLCTGSRESRIEEKVKQIGIKASIMKPFVIRSLALAIRTALDGHA